VRFVACRLPTTGGGVEIPLGDSRTGSGGPWECKGSPARWSPRPPETVMDLLDPGACGNQMDSAAAMGQTVLAVPIMRRSWRPYRGETA
jgi:hypothetical protein